MTVASSFALVASTSKNLADLSDEELVKLSQNNNHAAFGILLKRHERLVFGMLRKKAPDWNDAADLAQECFIRMWRGIKDLQNPKAFKSWVCQIVTHLFYDELRKTHRRSPALSLEQSFDDDDDFSTRDIADDKAGPEELLLRKESRKVVREAIQKLPEQFRTAMMLRDLEDMTYDDIANLTATDIGTVKSRISRARAKVQKVLPADFGRNAHKRSA